MMLKSIKTTENNRLVVADLTKKLAMGPENQIARIALAYSLSFGERLNLSDMGDSKGKEYSSKVLFGDYEDIYLSSICQLYKINKTNLDLARYVKIHLDDGLEKIFNTIKDNPNLSVFDFILDLIDNGLTYFNNEVNKN